MGFWHKDREPQPPQTVTKEALVDLNARRPQPEETNTKSSSRRRQLSGAEAENSAAQAQSAKGHRRSLAVSVAETSEPPSESQPQSEPQRPRLADAAVASQEPESEPKPGRSRGAITHPCDYLPELQNITNPPHSAPEDTAQAPRNETPEPQPSAKPGRPCLSIGRTDSDEPPLEPPPEPGPRRARLAVDISAASEESPLASTVVRSRGAITHPSDDPPELQNIIDPPRSISEEPAPPPPEKTPEPQSHVDPAEVQQFVQQFVAELRARQHFSMALVGCLPVAVIAAAVWALITTATNYPIGWMAVGVGLLVGGAVRMLGRGIDRSFGYLGAMMSVLGCLLGSLLSACTIVAGQGGLSLVAVLAHVCAKPALVPAAMIAAFQPLDLLFYGIAIYEGYRFSFRQVTDVEITRALDRK